MSRTQFRTTYEISPIILVGGIAQNVPGGLLPIVSITQALDFPDGITGSQLSDTVSQYSLDDYFAHYKVLPGGNLISNQIGKYPFANQTVAGNAIIVQPLEVSIQMMCPVRETNGYDILLSTIQSLKSTLDNHTNLGGTFNIATPAYVYSSGVLLNLRDITPGDSKQAQIIWQWDFEFPLLTEQQATQAQNSLMQKLTNQTPVAGDPPSYSGSNTNINSTASSAGASTVPAAQGLSGVVQVQI